MYKYSMWFSISDDDDAGVEMLSFMESDDIIDKIEDTNIKNPKVTNLICKITDGEPDDLASCYFSIELIASEQLSEKELNKIYEILRDNCSEDFDDYGTYDIFCLASDSFQFDGEID